MNNISFPVGPNEAYDSPVFRLTPNITQIQATFEDGEHLFTSPDFNLGTVGFDGQALIGRLTFRYSYDSVGKSITICSTDYPSADGMTMMTRPEGMDDQACFEHAANCGFLADEGYRNGQWNYYGPLTPGAPQRMKGIVRAANDALINALVEALKENPDFVVRIRQILPDLPLEDFRALCFVSRRGAQGRYGFDPTERYGVHDQIHMPFSTFAGTEAWGFNNDFANVIGSTPDPRPPSTSWINLWRTAMGRNGPNCTSRGFPSGVVCSTGSVGGHIIRGQTASVVATGSNNVRIFPICKSHNGRDSTYMQTRDENWAVVLHNYMQ